MAINFIVNGFIMRNAVPFNRENVNYLSNSILRERKYNNNNSAK